MCARILHSTNAHPSPTHSQMAVMGGDGNVLLEMRRREARNGRERSFYNKGDDKFLKSLFKVSKIATTLFFIRSK